MNVVLRKDGRVRRRMKRSRGGGVVDEGQRGRRGTWAVLLGLAFAVGVLFLPEGASAQSRNTFRQGFGTSITPGVSGSVEGTVGSKSITFRTITGWVNTVLYACAKTSTPTSGLTTYLASGCAETSPRPGRTDAGDFTTNVNVTQAMIDNGGFVIAIKWDPAVGEAIVYAQWVPLTKLVADTDPGTSGVQTAALAITEGGSGTLRCG